MRELLLRRSALITYIFRYEQRGTGSIEQFKATAHLVGGTRLHINEVWFDGQLSKYAYYWLTASGRLIQGWDNAPHHDDIETFPHHSHTPQGIRPSFLRSLDEVLDELERRLSAKQR